LKFIAKKIHTPQYIVEKLNIFFGKEEDKLFEPIACMYTSPLLVACEEHCENVVHALIKAKVDVNETSLIYEDSAIIRAHNHEGITAALIAAHANVNQETRYHKYTALIHASKQGNANVVRALLDAGANPDHVTHEKMTALMFACKGGHKDAVRELLKKADCNIISHDGLTAIMIARYYGYVETEELLLQTSGNTDITDSIDGTFLNILLERKDLRREIKPSLKEAAKYNFHGYILECTDTFSAPTSDNSGVYYKYCKDIEAVIIFLDKYKHYLGIKISQPNDCCEYVWDVQSLIKKRKPSYHVIKEWLEQNNVAYSLTPEGHFVASL
jgi:Ankyrin repeats (3 copies)